MEARRAAVSGERASIEIWVINHRGKAERDWRMKARKRESEKEKEREGRRERGS